IFRYPCIGVHQTIIERASADGNKRSQLRGREEILFFDLQAILGDKVIAAAIFVTIEQEDALVQRNQHARYPESSPSGDYKKIEVAAFVHVSFGKTSRSQDEIGRASRRDRGERRV